MKVRNIFVALVCIALLYACKKDNQESPGVVSIAVINAIADVPNVKVNASGKAISWGGTTAQVAYGARGFYYAPQGTLNLLAVPSADTIKNIFNKQVTLIAKAYTLYLFGTAAAPDTIFKEEVNFPFIRSDYAGVPSADSVVNLRFVNLSVGSPALKVKLSTSTSNEVDNLPYKTVTSWKAYPARLTTTAYSFQIRNAATDALITTFSFSATGTNRFKNVTLVIRGVFGVTSGTAPFGLTAMNYF